MIQRGWMLPLKSLWRSSLSHTTCPATLQTPDRHKEFIRMLCVHVLVLTATAHEKVPLCFLYGHTFGHARRATEAGVWRQGGPCWLAEASEERGAPQRDRMRSSARSEDTSGGSYSGGGRRLWSFLSSRPFQYLKLLSKCCIRFGRSAKASHASNMSVIK